MILCVILKYDGGVSHELWMPIGLFALNIYALALVLLRGPLYKTKVYRPMVLNIGLSLAPAGTLVLFGLILLGVIAIAPALPSVVAGLLTWVFIILGGLIWLLLLPNSAYLITELNLSHRKKDENVPLWYDIVLVMTLALSGMFNALVNVAIAQLFIVLMIDPSIYRPGTNWHEWIALAITLILVSLGMYLGRYMRLNSWDLLHPSSFIRKMKKHFITENNTGAAIGFVMAHSVLLLILYVIVVLPSLGSLLTP